MANTFHVAVYVQSIPEAVEQYRKVLGIEPAKVRHDYAKFELQDPPVIFSLNIGGEPGKLSHLGIRYPSTGRSHLGDGARQAERASRFCNRKARRAATPRPTSSG